MNGDYGIVYMVVCFVNGKRYIGQTVQSLSERMRKHVYVAKQNNGRGCAKFHNALRKHEHNNFYCGIIRLCSSKIEMDVFERYYIDKYDTVRSGYNLDYGGQQSSRRSEETKQKIRESKIGSKNPMYGRPVSEETRLKRSASSKGRKLSDETRARMSKAQKLNPVMRGKKHSEETKRKIGEKSKGHTLSIEARQAIGAKNKVNLLGRKLSDKTREKMKISQLRRWANRKQNRDCQL